ncbi:MAG: hypothetical protein ABFD46_09025 [Armatimonadota bacterium]
MRVTANESGEGTILARLAVIESKIETLIEEVASVREFIPAKMVEHAERITVQERNMRAIQWLAGVFMVAIIGAFVAHILGR